MSRRPYGFPGSPVGQLGRGVVSVVLAAMALACGNPSSDEEVSSADSPGAEASPEAWFVERAGEAGLEAVLNSGHTERFLMPEIMTGGAALFDAEGDGDLDVFLVQGRPQGDGPRAANRFFRNLGPDAGGRAHFVDASAESGDAAWAGFASDPDGWGMGVATGDVDGDGDIDLYLTRVGPNVLLLNQGDGAFVDQTETAGVGDPGWGSSAVFFDAEGDGDLDLYVSNYLVWSPSTEVDCLSPQGWPDYCSPQSYDAPAVDVLYRNLGVGPGGIPSFAAVEGAVGRLPGTGLGVAVADFDGDRRPEIFVANDGMPDRLWVAADTDAQGFPRYEDQAVLAGCAVDMAGQAKAGMGVSVADIDHDGDPDLLVCNLDRESDSLFRNEGGVFVDSTAALGLGAVSQAFTRFGMAWVDFDNDGRLDLYQANGRVALPASSQEPDPFAELNLVFYGTEDLGFREVLPRGGTAEPLLATSRAAVFGDVDGDGGVDILVINRDARVHLLHNRVAQRGHWLLLDVRTEAGAPALGAEILVQLGESARRYEVRSAYSYQAANDPRVHLGLGDATRVDRLVVRWPTGREAVLEDIAADQVLEIRPPEREAER